jgi:putative peptidoglycan lipid II flippase
VVGRLLNAKSKTVGIAAVILGVASLASRLFGLVRDRLLAGTFGAGPELDAYYAAFRIPDLVYSLFVFGAISAGFIPVFAKFADEGRESDNAASDLVSRVSSLLGLALAALAAVGALTAPWFTPYITPGFTESQITLTAQLTRLMFLSPLLLGLSGVLGAMLQTRKRFLVYSIAPVLYNLGIIVGILLWAGNYGVRGVAYGVILGAAFHLAVQAWACRDLGLKLRFRPDPRHPAISEVIRLTLPRIGSLGANQLFLIMVTTMITALGAGSLAVYNLALNLVYVPINLIGVSVATAAFPYISELAAKGQHTEMIATVNRAVRTVFFFAVPATVAMLLLRAQIVRVVLGSGRFDWSDTIATADVLAYLSLGLFATALMPLMVRAFLAVKDVITPLIVQTVFAVIGIAAVWVAIRQGSGIAGVSLAIAMTQAVNWAVLWVTLRLKLGSLGEAQALKAVAVMTACGAVMAVAMQGVKIGVGSVVDMRSFFGIFSQGLAAGLTGLAVYAGAALLLGNQEARQAFALIRRKLSPAPVALRQESETIAPEA